MNDTTSSVPLILLVDDETELRMMIKEILEADGFRVKDAPDGRVAMNLFTQEKFSLVISDIRMPGVDGVELLKFVRKLGCVPFIVMTGFSEVLETQKAFELGANEFFSKPFKKNDLLLAVHTCLKDVLRAAVQPEPPKAVRPLQDFHPVNIEEFTSTSILKFDLYLKLNETKFIKIANCGQEISADRIAVYKSKGLHSFHLTTPDFRTYFALNAKIVTEVEKAGVIPKDKKLRLLRHTTEVMMEKVYLDGVDKQEMNGARTVVDATASILSDDDDAFEVLQMLNGHTDFLYSHSVGVSMYSVMLAKNLGWNTPPILFRVSMGGLFHDVGLKEIDPAILKKPRKALTREELQVYETHSFRGKQILENMPRMPEDVMFTAFQHHENVLGYGFPSHLKKEKIHPMARLIAVADEFCELVLKGGPECEGLTPEQAISKILKFKEDQLDASMLIALMNIFKYPVPPSLIKKKAG